MAQAAIEFDIFGYVHDSRQTYGLRAQDYSRYRRYCAHHLRTVRKSVKMMQGTSTVYRKKEVTAEEATKPAHIEILVLEAERAWAYAMDLRELFSRTEEPRQRYHLIRRLKAACKAGSQLATVAASICDRRTSLAAYAYWLQIQGQMHFELGEWEAALDCAVLSRVVGKHLALTGSSRQYALAHAMIETQDPIVRLAAYQARVSGAQQLQPEEITTAWYTSKIKEDPSRIERTIAGYGKLAETLDDLTLSARDSDSNGSAAAAGLQDHAFANQLEWRGGKIAFANAGLSALLEAAQAALQSAVGSDGRVADDCSSSTTADAVAAFNKVKKASHSCYVEEIASSSKVASAASEVLSSAYLAIQLYSICVLHAIAAVKYVGQAETIAAKLGFAPGSSDSVLAFSGSGSGSSWLGSSASTSPDALATGKSGAKRVSVGRLPELTRTVVLYDMARKSISQLRSASASVLAKMSPGMSRAIRGHQIAEEIAITEAYYDCLRGYYSAALHAQPRYRRYLASLALLDAARTETLPRAAALVASAESKQVAPQPSSLAADSLWAHLVSVSNSDISQIEASVKSAIPVVHRLCTAAESSKPASKDWHTDPSSRPAMVPSKFVLCSASGGGGVAKSALVPRLVDLHEVAFAPVPVKPLFYDLAAPAIDFDMDAISARAGKQGGGSSSKLGSIIGSLWGSR